VAHTADPAQSGGYVWSDGEGPYWKVYLNTGSGFASSWTRWAVPDSGLGDGFFAAMYGDGPRYWSLQDLTADGRPDLVQTADSAQSGGYVWTDTEGAYWRVFKNTGGGFQSAATRWSVPESGLGDGFFTTVYAWGARFWYTMDLDGDGSLELVHTANVDQDNGFVWQDASGPHWRVYPRLGDGFAATWTRWNLPESGLGDGFFLPSWTDGERAWSTLDLDGDGAPELVHTADPSLDGGKVWVDAAGPYWRVFEASGDGFGTSWKRWGVPESGLGDGFFTAAWTSGPRAWSVWDMTGDGRLDLVQTADPAVDTGAVWSGAGGAFWKVFEAAP
jgi:hypothetical protein